MMENWAVSQSEYRKIHAVIDAARVIAAFPDFDHWYDFMIYRNGSYIDIDKADEFNPDEGLFEWVVSVLRFIKPEVARDIPANMIDPPDHPQ